MAKPATVLSVYLGGGLKGTWQDKVQQQLPGFIYLDPRTHKLTREADYTAWDLAAIDRCDLLVGFMSKDNPGGAGLALEIGWAAKAGKSILLVEEPGFAQQRYFGMARALADQFVLASDEDAAVQAICTWLRSQSTCAPEPALSLPGVDVYGPISFSPQSPVLKLSPAAQPSPPDGWKLVPLTPTPAMRKAGALAKHSRACDGQFSYAGAPAAEAAYDAMVRAAPHA